MERLALRNSAHIETTGPQYSTHLGDGTIRRVEMLKYGEREDDVKTAVPEWQRVSIGEQIGRFAFIVDADISVPQRLERR